MLARYLLPPPVSTFAPFTALVALQATVYRSVRDCLQYVLAMAAGATLAASLAALAGVHGWTFGILTLVALCVGKVRRLGQQGTQVAIVGFFAFSSGRGQIAYIGHLVAAVGIGALCGLAAHLVFAPARHTHHRQQAVTDLYTTMAQRVNNLADTLEASDPDRDHLRQWRRDWHGLSAECERIRRAIDTEVENGRMNPRAVLRSAATAMEEIGQASPTDPDLLGAQIDEAATELERVQRRERTAPGASPAVHALQGTLLTDAGRLLADLRSGWQSDAREDPRFSMAPRDVRAGAG
ncbi:aromatic acid exporter family protein [Streptomyces sp. NPDC058290]|uniref:aromatic acid exporter family protein n=1 Tax=Streptomyces sp. NPDC058290 TaxID=3346426 RepID=UPI0036E65581